MTANSMLRALNSTGWTSGLVNMLDNELGLWWRTRRWWVQAVIWVAMVGFFLSVVTFTEKGPDFKAAAIMYGLFGGLPPIIGTIILMQDTLVGEKKDGTAAWILSKPVARSAFVLSKLVAYSISELITMVLLPGFVAYGLLSYSIKAPLDVWRFLAVLGILFLNVMFYLTLTLMLGSLSNSRGLVIGIPLAVAFIQQYLIGFLPPIRYFIPWTLIVPVNSRTDSMVSSLILGRPIDSYAVLLGVSLDCIIFALISVLRFRKEEF